MPPKPTFFPTPSDFRAWLEAHHDKFQELFVGFHKKESGKPSITWPQSVDEALCFGWIDGVRRSIDEISYTIRFTPRKPRSIWSNVNVAKVETLIRQGRMTPSGLAAYALRDPARSGIYSFERETASFDGEMEGELNGKRPGWSFF